MVEGKTITVEINHPVPPGQLHSVDDNRQFFQPIAVRMYGYHPRFLNAQPFTTPLEHLGLKGPVLITLQLLESPKVVTF